MSWAEQFTHKVRVPENKSDAIYQFCLEQWGEPARNLWASAFEVFANRLVTDDGRWIEQWNQDKCDSEIYYLYYFKNIEDAVLLRLKV